MARIVQNVSLAPEIQGREACAANAHDVALFTGNWFAAFSTDSGNSFHSIDPYEMMCLVGGTFCCDQVVDYVPSVDRFVWVLLGDEGTMMLAAASPEEIRGSNGRRWFYYHITPRHVGFGQYSFDYPEISFGNNYLYLGVDLTINRQGVTEKRGVLMRLPLSQIRDREAISMEFVLPPGNKLLCPAHGTGDVGLFAGLNSTSQIRVFSWPESAPSPVTWFDVDIDTVPDKDYSSATPEEYDWLLCPATIYPYISGAARSGDDLWLAWSGARKIAGETENCMPQPHIGLAVVSISGKHLKSQSYIWSPDYAYAWPTLAANSSGEVGISFAWGGGAHYPQHGVGILTGTRRLLSTTSGRTRSTGDDYVKVRRSYPRTNQFVAGGFVERIEGGDSPRFVNSPHYVIFEP